MGGHAFRQASLPDSAFPRLPPAVYQALKARVTPLLKAFYVHVETPIEAPEKADYGDLDFSTAVPISPDLASSQGELSMSHHEPEVLKPALGAIHCMARSGGGQTSNYAIPVRRGEWSVVGYDAFEEECRRDASKDNSADIYYQVDIHVCRDKEELDRLVFFNSYGDLGMIMGLVASNIGLKLSSKGLFCPNQPLAPVALSTSFQDICNYMGWSYARHVNGEIFQSQEEVFQWIAESKFYQARHFRTRNVPGATKVKPERNMYSSFIQWSEARQREQGNPPVNFNKFQEQGRAEALVYFGKKEEVERIIRDRNLRIQFNENFNGQKVRHWTGMGEYWHGTKAVMDLVRKEHSPESLMSIFEEDGEMGLKALCLEAKARLGFEKDPMTGLIVQMEKTVI